MLEDPDYGLAYAIPNGGKRNKKTAVDMQAEGVKSGVPDVCFPVPRYPYHGLYIEMKRTQGGKIEEKQKSWNVRLNEKGYYAVVCRGSGEAIAVIEAYFKLPRWWKGN